MGVPDLARQVRSSSALTRPYFVPINHRLPLNGLGEGVGYYDGFVA